MNTNPTLTELIESAIRSVGRVEAILDRMEARERVMEAAHAEADIQWAPTDPAPGHPELPLAEAVKVGTQLGKTQLVSEWVASLAASTPHVQLQELPTATGEGPAVDLAMPRKSPSGPDRFADAEPVSIAQQAANDLRAAPVAPADPTKPRLIPEVGAYYWLRNGKTARIRAREGESFKGEIHGIDGDAWLPFHWHADGAPYGNIGPRWELVELCPF